MSNPLKGMLQTGGNVADTTIQTGPALDSSSVTRAFTVFLLYAGQGIPIGLFDFAIPAWMAVNGATAQDIGFVVAMIGIPWSFKFVAGFIMDRYTLLAMGRRRAWILGAQTMMIALLLFFAIIDPGPRDVLILGLVALAVNTATVFQDVAVDGLTVDIVPEEERSLAGALSSGGQVMGIAASAALTGRDGLRIRCQCRLYGLRRAGRSYHGPCNLGARARHRASITMV